MQQRRLGIILPVTAYPYPARAPAALFIQKQLRLLSRTYEPFYPMQDSSSAEAQSETENPTAAHNNQPGFQHQVLALMARRGYRRREVWRAVKRRSKNYPFGDTFDALMEKARARCLQGELAVMVQEVPQHARSQQTESYTMRLKIPEANSL